MSNEYSGGAKPDDVIASTFVIMQNVSPVKKQVKMTRAKFLEYNARPKNKWADMYAMIVADKAYISIKDLTGSKF